ncbi:hypothetical protein L6258_00685, partial [Candidatus Parcubacteria bacterium]|nr:hypothetical protein [Candidatus Parcubacteria bacterium]
VVLFFIVTRKPFYPRYFFPVLPFLSIAAGVGISTLSEFMANCIKKAHPASVTMFRNIRTLIVLVVVAGMAPTAWEALQATDPHLIEEVTRYIHERSVQDNPYVFSNWWPNIVGQAVGTEHFSWLAESGEEIEAFLEGEERSALEILEQAGGWVVLEEEYSRRLISPAKDRASAVELVRERFEPVKIVTDIGSNFPYFRGGNQILIYRF